MTFSTQDKLALMMTSAPSQRGLASLIGVSHQRVGRWLTIGQSAPDGTPSTVRPPTDPAILAAIDNAFAIHTQLAREQARADKIPFSKDAPVFAHRLPLIDGTPGGRVVIPNTHRLSDSLRNKVIANGVKTKRYNNVSVRSTVDLKRYFQQAEKRYQSGNHRYQRGKAGSKTWANRAPLKEVLQSIQQAYKAGEIDEQDTNIRKAIFTPYTSMEFDPAQVLADVNHNLAQRHQPATGEKGTEFADEILLQLKTTTDPMGPTIERSQHATYLIRKAKSAKARRHKQRAKRKG